MIWRSGWFVASAVALSLSGSACGDDTDLEVHAPLWGYVTGPDGPLEARVVASGNHTVAHADTDSTGRYEMPLAAGTYRVAAGIRNFGTLHLGSDRRFDWAPRGRQGANLEIDPLMNPIRIDIQLSSAEITVDGLDFGEGREITATFSRQSAAARVSDGSATLIFPLVTTGEQLLEVEGAFVPGTYLESAATRFPIHAGDRNVIRAALTVQPAVVNGTVVDSFGFVESIARILKSGNLTFVALDSTGQFTVAAWENEVRFVAITEDGPFGLSQIGDGDAETISLVAGEAIKLSPFVLPGVTVRPVGKPGYRAVFWMRNDSGRVWSDDSPPYVLGPLPAGRHLLGVGHQDSCRADWIPTRCESPELCDAVPIDIDIERPAMHIAFPLQTGARIEGRILGFQPGRWMDARLFEDKGTVCSARPESYDNYFSFSGLRSGSYRLRFEVQNGILWYPGVSSEEEAAIIEIIEAEEQTWLEMAWPDSL